MATTLTRSPTGLWYLDDELIAEDSESLARVLDELPEGSRIKIYAGQEPEDAEDDEDDENAD